MKRSMLRTYFKLSSQHTSFFTTNKSKEVLLNMVWTILANQVWSLPTMRYLQRSTRWSCFLHMKFYWLYRRTILFSLSTWFQEINMFFLLTSWNKVFCSCSGSLTLNSFAFVKNKTNSIKKKFKISLKTSYAVKKTR